MKKLITLLTTTSFSLVPTVNIIACESKAEEEIVGETIAQEIVDGAIDEMKNSTVASEPLNAKTTYEYTDFRKIVVNYAKYPEFIFMYQVLLVCSNLNEKGIGNENISKLNLNYSGNSGTDLLKNNIEKFKVVPSNEKWFESVKSEALNKTKEYEFKLKFGKTLSEKKVKINLYWN